MKIGFIGQGWIGRNYANDFEGRGFDVVRYGLEDEFKQNKPIIKKCDVVFIAVPTPSTKKGFDYSNVEEALKLVGKKKIAIIKSTIQPGTTEALQKKFKSIIVVHSPEFLREIFAAYDAANPERNIVGIPSMSALHKKAAELIHSILPKANYSKTVLAKEAELIKYIGNCFLYEKVVFFNKVHDLADAMGMDYSAVRELVGADPRIGYSHTNVAHASGHNLKIKGRGAGGHCFIKDYEAFIELYKKKLPNDKRGHDRFEAIKSKNYEYLVKSKKDLDLLKGVIEDFREYEK